MPTYTIKCDVKLAGAIMTVVAASKSEAIEKAGKGEWEDIDYKGAALVDWEPDRYTLREDK